MFRVCHAFLSVHCSLVVTCKEGGNLLALLCVMFCCVFVTFPCGVMGEVRFCLFYCFSSQVNSYGHGGRVSSPNQFFSCANLNKQLTSTKNCTNRAHTFACN